jgi:hypothetical protein
MYSLQDPNSGTVKKNTLYSKKYISLKKCDIFYLRNEDLLTCAPPPLCNERTRMPHNTEASEVGLWREATQKKQLNSPPAISLNSRRKFHLAGQEVRTNLSKIMED